MSHRRFLFSLPGRTTLYLLLAVPGSVAFDPGVAQESPVAMRELAFDIAPGPLDQTLAAFSRLTGIQMLYDSSLVAGLRSEGIRGRFTLGVALSRLLQGTRLRARFLAGGAIVITRSETPEMVLDTVTAQAPPMIGGDPDARWMPYVARVRSEIEAAIRADPDLGSGAYRIDLSIWLRPDGGVVRSKVVGTSGDPARDAKFQSVIQTLRISERPPPDLPEPMRIEFSIG